MTFPLGMDGAEYDRTIAAMQQYGGSFASALGRAWLYADLGNRSKLEQAFPELLKQYRDMAMRILHTREDIE